MRTHTPVQNVIAKACMYGLYVIQKSVGPGACCKISSTREKNSCAQHEDFSVMGFARKVLGLKYRVLRLKMVVSDLSNWS